MKIILFLLLLYFCNTDDAPDCHITPPSKAQDCYSRKVADSEKNYCCYVYMNDPDEGSYGQCLGLQKSDSSEQKEDAIIKDFGNSISILKIQCPGEKNEETSTHNSSSYLKIGFLFILALLF